MKYALLIYTNETAAMQASEAEQQAVMEAYNAFTNELRTAGNNLGGEALLPTSMAKSVRVRAGESVVTDGPFAETKEQLGGFYLVEAATEAEAIQWAAKIPGAKHGTVEVRPLMEFE
jgi:hypothetical protein